MRGILFIKKGIVFTWHFMFLDPVFLLRYGITYFQDSYSAGVKFFSQEDTLHMFKTGKSFIRFGDGEAALIHMRALHFQDTSLVLREQLLNIISNYSDKSAYLLALPERYINQTNRELRHKNLFTCWQPLRVMFRQRFPRDVLYADAHPFYIKGFFEKDVAPIIMKKHLIICTNAHTIATQRSKFESIFKIQAWVETPVTNSFSVLGVVYDRVMDEYSQLIEKGLSAQDVVVLVSSGPMGKVLAFQCSKNGIQCLDIGHGFETFYTDDMRLQNALI